MIKIASIIDGKSFLTDVLVDSGASMNFLSWDFLNPPLYSLFDPRNTARRWQEFCRGFLSASVSVSVLSTENTSGSSALSLPDSASSVLSDFLVAPLTYEVILGIPWLQKANPAINWRTLSLKNTSDVSPIELCSVVCQPQRALPDGVPKVYANYAQTPSIGRCLPPLRSFDLKIEFKDSQKNSPYLPLYHLSQKEEGIL